MFFNKLKNYIKEKNLEKYVEYLYLASLCIYCFKVANSSSTLLNLDSNIASILYKTSFVLLLPKIVLQDYSKKDLFISIGIMILALYKAYFLGSMNIIIFPMLLIGVKDSDIKTVIRCLFYTIIFTVILHAICFTINYINTNGTIIGLLRIKANGVNGLYFGNHNSFAIRAICAMILYLYLTDRNDKRYIKTIGLFIYSILIYLLAQSTTSLIISLLVICYMMLENNSFFKKNINKLMLIVIFGSIAISIIFLYADINNPIFAKLNTFLTGRIGLGIKARNIFGIQLLPNSEFIENTSTLPVDNFLSFSLLGAGIIYTIIQLILVIYVASREEDTYLEYIIAILFIWAISEGILYKGILFGIPFIILNRQMKK